MQVRKRKDRIEVLRSFRDETLGRSNQRIVGKLPLSPEAGFGLGSLSADLDDQLSYEELEEVRAKIVAIRKDYYGRRAHFIIRDAPAEFGKLELAVEAMDPKKAEPLSVAGLFMAIDSLAEALYEKGFTRLVFEADGMNKKHTIPFEASAEIHKLTQRHEKEKRHLREGAKSITQRAEGDREAFDKRLADLQKVNDDLHAQIKELEEKLRKA